MAEEVAANQALRELLLFLSGTLIGALVALLLGRRRRVRMVYAPVDMEVGQCGYEVVDVAARRVQL
ncbi:MAG: hypothetical protein QW324_04845 [Thermofilaceae archaeon]